MEYNEVSGNIASRYIYPARKLKSYFESNIPESLVTPSAIAGLKQFLDLAPAAADKSLGPAGSSNSTAYIIISKALELPQNKGKSAGVIRTVRHLSDLLISPGLNQIPKGDADLLIRICNGIIEQGEEYQIREDQKDIYD